mmetsp:Transcript_8481/g.18663  ORF Transcript_8481/g.18663 Transcript_8481/m.18663 type:complete len:294 (-) Transcript_8481:708-1589(-)
MLRVLRWCRASRSQNHRILCIHRHSHLRCIRPIRMLRSPRVEQPRHMENRHRGTCSSGHRLQIRSQHRRAHLFRPPHLRRIHEHAGQDRGDGRPRRIPAQRRRREDRRFWEGRNAQLGIHPHHREDQGAHHHGRRRKRAPCSDRRQYESGHAGAVQRHGRGRQEKIPDRPVLPSGRGRRRNRRAYQQTCFESVRYVERDRIERLDDGRGEGVRPVEEILRRGGRGRQRHVDVQSAEDCQVEPASHRFQRAGRRIYPDIETEKERRSGEVFGPDRSFVCLDRRARDLLLLLCVW